MLQKPEPNATRETEMAPKKPARGRARSSVANKKAAKKPATKQAHTKKAAKKPANKQAHTKKASVARRKAPSRPREVMLMSAEERRSKLKPRENYDELVEQIMRAMNNHPHVRIDGVKVSRLEKLLRAAQKANAKESDLRDLLARKLAPAVDRRVIAEDAVWRAVLDVNAGVKPYARKDGSIADAFTFLTAALSGTRSEPTDAPGTAAGGGTAGAPMG